MFHLRFLFVASVGVEASFSIGKSSKSLTEQQQRDEEKIRNKFDGYLDELTRNPNLSKLDNIIQRSLHDAKVQMKNLVNKDCSAEFFKDYFNDFVKIQMDACEDTNFESLAKREVSAMQSRLSYLQDQAIHFIEEGMQDRIQILQDELAAVAARIKEEEDQKQKAECQSVQACVQTEIPQGKLKKMERKKEKERRKEERIQQAQQAEQNALDQKENFRLLKMFFKRLGFIFMLIFLVTFSACLTHDHHHQNLDPKYQAALLPTKSAANTLNYYWSDLGNPPNYDRDMKGYPVDFSDRQTEFEQKLPFDQWKLWNTGKFTEMTKEANQIIVRSWNEKNVQSFLKNTKNPYFKEEHAREIFELQSIGYDFHFSVHLMSLGRGKVIKADDWVRQLELEYVHNYFNTVDKDDFMVYLEYSWAVMKFVKQNWSFQFACEIVALGGSFDALNVVLAISHVQRRFADQPVVVSNAVFFWYRAKAFTKLFSKDLQDMELNKLAKKYPGTLRSEWRRLIEIFSVAPADMAVEFGGEAGLKSEGWLSFARMAPNFNGSMADDFFRLIGAGHDPRFVASLLIAGGKFEEWDYILNLPMVKTRIEQNRAVAGLGLTAWYQAKAYVNGDNKLRASVLDAAIAVHPGSNRDGWRAYYAALGNEGPEWGMDHSLLLQKTGVSYGNLDMAAIFTNIPTLTKQTAKDLLHIGGMVGRPEDTRDFFVLVKEGMDIGKAHAAVTKGEDDPFQHAFVIDKVQALKLFTEDDVRALVKHVNHRNFYENDARMVLSLVQVGADFDLAASLIDINPNIEHWKFILHRHPHFSVAHCKEVKAMVKHDVELGFAVEAIAMKNDHHYWIEIMDLPLVKPRLKDHPKLAKSMLIFWYRAKRFVDLDAASQEKELDLMCKQHKRPLSERKDLREAFLMVGANEPEMGIQMAATVFAQKKMKAFAEKKGLADGYVDQIISRAVDPNQQKELVEDMETTMKGYEYFMSY